MQEVAKISTSLVKQRALLLEKQIEQQKKLIMKLEQGKDTLRAEERDKLRDTIRSLQTSIEATKRELAACTAAKAAAPPKPRTKQDVEKAVLDTELELYSKQGTGTPEAVELEQKLENLKRLATAMGATTATTAMPPATAVMRPAGGVGPVFRGRGAMRARPYGYRGGRFAMRYY